MVKYNDYNNKKAYEKYKKVIAAERKFFEDNGLKGESLEKVLEYTEKQFKEECSYNLHKVSINVIDKSDEYTEESRNALYYGNKDRLMVEIDFSQHSYLGWIQEIKNEKILDVLRRLTDEELKILTEILIKGETIKDTAVVIGCSRQRVSRIYKKILDKLKVAIEN